MKYILVVNPIRNFETMSQERLHVQPLTINPKRKRNNRSQSPKYGKKLIGMIRLQICKNNSKKLTLILIKQILPVIHIIAITRVDMEALEVEIDCQ